MNDTTSSEYVETSANALSVLLDDIDEYLDEVRKVKKPVECYKITDKYHVMLKGFDFYLKTWKLVQDSHVNVHGTEIQPIMIKIITHLSDINDTLQNLEIHFITMGRMGNSIVNMSQLPEVKEFCEEISPYIQGFCAINLDSKCAKCGGIVSFNLIR